MQTEGTIGIENAAETVGLQYLFDGAYDSHAHPIADHFAILYTTRQAEPGIDVTLTPINPPIVIPANGGSFNFTAAVLNNGPTQVPFSVWAKVRNPDGT